MWADDYQTRAMRTAGKFVTLDDQQVFAALEIAAEAGEVANLIYKQQFQGHNPNPDRVVEELGDILWGIACMSAALGVPLSTVMERNIAKLAIRYPNGFTSADSIARVDQPPPPPPTVPPNDPFDNPKLDTLVEGGHNG